MMELTFKLQRAANLVFDYLTDMQKFASVHPVIYQIDAKRDGSYLVHEKLRIGFIPFAFTYPATVEQDMAEKKVIIRARVFKLVSIEMYFAIKNENDYTVVNELIEFKTWLPIKAVMQRVFQQQHQVLFQQINALDE